MSNNKRFYIRPEDPTDPKVFKELSESIVDWVLKCRDDFQKRQAVKVPVLDLENDEVIEMEIDQECLDAMDAADEEIDRKREAARQRDRELDSYARDDE